MNLAEHPTVRHFHENATPAPPSRRSVPNQILVPFVAKLKVYGYRPHEGQIPELLSILETHGVRYFRSTRRVCVGHADSVWRQRSHSGLDHYFRACEVGAFFLAS